LGNWKSLSEKDKEKRAIGAEENYTGRDKA
jgi:hypothetical protein